MTSTINTAYRMAPAGPRGPPNSGHLSGERDTIGKANKAWQTLTRRQKRVLLRFPKYLRQGASGNLTYINMSIEAWPSLAPEVIRFFQVTAGFRAYLSPGGETWPTNSIQEELVGWANNQSLSAPTDQIVIISY